MHSVQISPDPDARFGEADFNGPTQGGLLSIQGAALLEFASL